MSVKKNFMPFLLLLALTACTNPTILTPTSIELRLGGEAINNLTLTVGEVVDLDAVVAPEGALQTVTWLINDPDVASIDEDGVITALSAGTTTVKATSSSVSYVSKSGFLEVREPIIYGSGKSSSDPLFIGETSEEEPLEIYFIEMQHIYADSLYLKKGGVDILIDSGWAYDGNFISAFLDEHVTDGRLDVLMASHNDSDHVDGFSNALKNIDDVSLIVDFGHLANRGVYGTIKDAYVEGGATYHPAIDCINYANGASKRYYLTNDFYFDILNTGNYVADGSKNAGNPNSLAVIFTYKDFKFFTAGDLTTSSESRLMQLESLPEVTLYKASHHGSHGSNSQPFMDTLNPKGVAISAARANQFNVVPGSPSQTNTYNLNGASGHPAAEAIGRIYKIPNIKENLNVYWNAVNGTMCFKTYGTDSFTFSGSKPNKGYYDLTLTEGIGVWNAALNDFENKVTREENLRFHESKVFQFRNYNQYLPA